MARLAEEVPEYDRARLGLVALDSDLRDALLGLLAWCSGQREPGDVTLHVGHEHRHAKARETFGHHHERHGLARAGGARDEPVAVTVLREQRDLVVALA